MLSKNQKLSKLMEQELSVLQKVKHPNIMDVKTILHDHKTYNIFTEICEGGELFERTV